MSTRTDYAPGTFCWPELSTSDSAAAKAFYGAVLGWEAHDQPVGEGAVYTLLRLAGDDVAALYQRDEQRMRSHWLSYVSVESADDTAARAAELGGAIISAPFDVTTAGRMAVVQDPQDAVFALWQPGEHPGAGRVNEPGALCWNDLRTPSPAEAAPFYAELFGWAITEIAESHGHYFRIANGQIANGGMLRSEPGTDVEWITYFAVESLDEAAATVRAHGGTVSGEPMPVPGGRFVTVRDPQGAPFALFDGQLDP